jgi:hypothetical protein
MSKEISCQYIHSIVHSSMAVQAFAGPWPVFQFRNPIHIRQDSLDRGSAHHKAATYTQNSINT